jgi:hypothetical protein
MYFPRRSGFQTTLYYCLIHVIVNQLRRTFSASKASTVTKGRWRWKDDFSKLLLRHSGHLTIRPTLETSFVKTVLMIMFFVSTFHE